MIWLAAIFGPSAATLSVLSCLSPRRQTAQAQSSNIVGQSVPAPRSAAEVKHTICLKVVQWPPKQASPFAMIRVGDARTSSKPFARS
jgi:hypothetical protein